MDDDPLWYRIGVPIMGLLVIITCAAVLCGVAWWLWLYFAD